MVSSIGAPSGVRIGSPPEHRALHAARVGRSADGQRAQLCRRRPRALLGDTPRAPRTRASSTLGPGHARLDQVVVELQLRAMGPVALLDPGGRAVDADPHRHDTVRPPPASHRASHNPRPLLRSARGAPSPARPRTRPADASTRTGPRSTGPAGARTGSPRWTHRDPRWRRRRSRARSPHTPIVVQADVEVRDPRRTRHPGRWSGRYQSQVPHPPDAPPVTTRYRSWARHMIVRSAKIPPRIVRAAACRPTRPTGHVHLGDHDQPVQVGAGAGPRPRRTSRNARQVDHAHPVAHREMLGADDRRPPARIPFRVAAPDPPVPVLASSRSFEAYHQGRSQPAVS